MKAKKIDATGGKSVPITMALVVPTMLLGIPNSSPAARNPNIPIRIGITIKMKDAITYEGIIDLSLIEKAR